MSEPGFTKGDWVFGKPSEWHMDEPDLKDRFMSRGLVGADGRSIIDGCSNCGDIYLKEANAHLIVAAPDMHGELTEALVTLGELLNDNILPSGWAESISALVVGIEDTLSKARGETM